MAVPTPSTSVALRETRWGLGDAVGGWFVAYAATIFLGAIILALAGHTQGEEMSLVLIALTYPPLWLGFVAVPVWAAATKGNGWIIDFGGRIKAVDVPVGIVAGLVAQLLLVPLVSYPVLRLTGNSSDDLTAPARELADKAVGPGGALLFLLIVGVGAPIAEELFFRGLWLRSLEKRFSRWWALALSSVVFGATHLQPLQFAGLTTAGAVFGYLAQRTGRLGPAVVAHTTFNTTAVVSLLWLS